LCGNPNLEVSISKIERKVRVARVFDASEICIKMDHVRNDLALEFYEMDNDFSDSKKESNDGGYARRVIT